ncbi:unnamed protein product [Rhizophagus irregularis]|nr:unnamed protein product [Rhizophagus irregularis]
MLEAEKIAIDGLKEILKITINGLNEEKPSAARSDIITSVLTNKATLLSEIAAAAAATMPATAATTPAAAAALITPTATVSTTPATAAAATTSAATKFSSMLILL